ncbi:Uncharacterized protein GBIM_01214, partial [Gryllus bimaculatus]
MSSYLVAFVVSDFPFVEHGPFRILADPRNIDNTRYLLSVTPKLLEIMENITGVNYTLPKMDQVALPEISSGAMENWGLVTFRSDLIEPDDSLAKRQGITALFAHEFAHQWFGNLVSPQWWTYTWLSEGTATFFENVVISKLEPKWNMLSTAVTDFHHTALELDAIPEFSHPITRSVETPTEIAASFDSITYLKAPSGGTRAGGVPVSTPRAATPTSNRTAPLRVAGREPLTLQGLPAGDWLVLNVQDAAFYRVNYDERNWELLLTAMAQPDHDGIHPLNRAQLLDDAEQLGAARLLPAEVSLRALWALRNESDPGVWRPALRTIRRLYLRLANTDLLPALQEVFGDTMVSWARSKSAEEFGLPQQTMYDWAYALSDNFTRSDRPYFADENSTAWWCALVRNCDSMWDAVWRKYAKFPRYGSNRNREALAALGCARDAQRLLAATLSDGARVGGPEENELERRPRLPERVRPDDRLAALAAPCGSEVREAVGGGGARACEQAIEFFARNLDRF